MAAAEIKNTFGKRAPDGAWEIPILGDIGFFGVDGADLIRELQAVKPTQVRFTIYSPGGAVYDAIAVVGYMLEKGIESFTEIYGVCASAATVFAAHSGPKNTAIAPGSLFLVHMPFGGDQKAIDNATAFLVDLYVKAYGWTKAEAKNYMLANDNEGEFWTAAEAKKLGVCSEIMEGAKVAAHYQLKPTAMADNKTKVPVKLTFGKAVSAAFGGEVTAEVDVEQATADAIKEKDEEIATLKGQIATLEEAAKPSEGMVPEAQVTEAKAKVTELEATIASGAVTLAAKDTDIAALNTKIKELEAKVPLASRTIANNTDASIGRKPGEGDAPSAGDLIVRAAMKGANALQIAQAKLNADRNKPAA